MGGLHDGSKTSCVVWFDEAGETRLKRSGHVCGGETVAAFWEKESEAEAARQRNLLVNTFSILL